MTKIAYDTKEFRDRSVALIDAANAIIDEYEGQNLTLTLRQLFYQFVARDIIENSQRSYKNLGALMTDARNCGLVDWYGIEDRGRTPVLPYVMEKADEVISGLANHISADRWKDQETYIEVWVEKDALGSIVEQSCLPYQVTSLACRGYLSASEAWRASRRFKRAERDGKRCLLVHLGDHDPSGIDMTRDNSDRASFYWTDVEVKRIALNMDQVEEHNPPPNPAKITDSRAADYIARFGNESWELDALDPAMLRSLIQNEIAKHIDDDKWLASIRREENEAAVLQALEDNWHVIRQMIENDEF